MDVRGLYLGRGKRYSLLHSVRTGSVDHQASHKISTDGSYPGIKRRWREAGHSPPSSAEGNNAEDPLPSASSYRGA
jgi:hypothetical protein